MPGLGKFGGIMAIRSRLAQVAVAALGVLAVGPAVAASPAADLFYQRAVMTAADGACRLFAPDVATALAASKAQARGAALRSGADPAGLAAVEAQASAAGAASCHSPAIAAAADQVRAAFAGYAHLDHMDFPGEFAAWLAERPASDTEPRWHASQRDRFGWDVMRFGLAGHGDDRPLTAVASFADSAQPYGARLVMRDVDATSGPYLDARQADIDGHIPIDGRLPPRASSRVFEAGEMTAADKALVTPDMPGAWSFAFPQAASDALAQLDPRETVAVEFLFTGDDGESVRTAYVEVGDFAAARAFQSIPQQ
jgi:hypothetical protein